MGARLEDVCQALATRAQDFTEIPVLAEDPMALGVPGPIGIVHATTGTITLMGATQQTWLDAIRLDFYCSLAKLTPQVIKALRALPETVADAFAPGPDSTTYYRLGGIVARCAMVSYEFGNIDRNGTEYSVARFTFDVKRLRFAGDE